MSGLKLGMTEWRIISRSFNDSHIGNEIYREGERLDIYPDENIPEEVMGIVRENVRKFEHYPQLKEMASIIYI